MIQIFWIWRCLCNQETIVGAKVGTSPDTLAGENGGGEEKVIVATTIIIIITTTIVTIVTIVTTIITC